METRPIIGQIRGFQQKRERFTLFIIVKQLKLFTIPVMCQRSSL